MVVQVDKKTWWVWFLVVVVVVGLALGLGLGFGLKSSGSDSDGGGGGGGGGGACLDATNCSCVMSTNEYGVSECTLCTTDASDASCSMNYRCDMTTDVSGNETCTKNELGQYYNQVDAKTKGWMNACDFDALDNPLDVNFDPSVTLDPKKNCCADPDKMVDFLYSNCDVLRDSDDVVEATAPMYTGDYYLPMIYSGEYECDCYLWDESHNAIHKDDYNNLGEKVPCTSSGAVFQYLECKNGFAMQAYADPGNTAGYTPGGIKVDEQGLLLKAPVSIWSEKEFANTPTSFTFACDDEAMPQGYRFGNWNIPDDPGDDTLGNVMLKCTQCQSPTWGWKDPMFTTGKWKELNRFGPGDKLDEYASTEDYSLLLRSVTTNATTTCQQGWVKTCNCLDGDYLECASCGQHYA